MPKICTIRLNKPAYLPATAEFIAELRDEPAEEVMAALYDNARRLFGIEEE